MVNSKHDICYYDRPDYKREIFDGDVLVKAFKASMVDGGWKPQAQKFEMFYLQELAQIQQQLIDKNYKFKQTSEFIINERGKTRPIRGEQIYERIIKHAVCDEILEKSILPKLIYDNGASIKGKGVAFTRKRLLAHLQKYYRKHGNAGYILLIDFSKYYDNIQHEKLMNMIRDVVDNETALWFIEKSLDRSKVDVSYMTDEEYKNCMNVLFDSLEHRKIDKSLLTGEKYMHKHLDMGDQIAQYAGIYYPHKIDNYIKIVKGIKYYARYSDDSYVIHESKEYLQELRNEIIEKCKEYGIFVNTKKTRIYKLSEKWRYLQIQYSLTDTGRVIQKIHPKAVTRMRRKMKKVVYIMDSEKEFREWFQSWFNSQCKYMSKQQKKNLNELRDNLIKRRFRNGTN